MIRVLICDTNTNFCVKVKHHLEQDETVRIGVDVVSSLDAIRTKIQEHEAEPYDAFLIDYHFKGHENGIEIIRILRQLSPDTESILLIESSEPRIGLQAYESGAYRYIMKHVDMAELRWVLEGIHDLKVLNDIARQTQSVLGLKQVANILTAGGVRLGFDRARLYLVDEEQQQLVGLSQVGLDTLGDFTAIRIDIRKSPYAQRTAVTSETNYFHGLSLGANHLAQQFDTQAFPRPIGEWVDMPLRDGDRCIGILALDNYLRPRTYHAEKRRLLRLLSHQASAALRRGLRFEREMGEKAVGQMVKRITHETTVQGYERQIKSDPVGR